MPLSRRTLLAGSAAAPAAPAALRLAEGTAQAAATYDVAVCEQYRNQVRVYSWAAGWTSPGSNPHAVERIPNIGAVVAASSGGYPHVYGPSAISDPSTLALVQTISNRGAHGLWYGHVNGWLWAVGQDKATSYQASGSYRNTRLVNGIDVSIGAGNLGPSLDASSHDSGILLVSHTTAVVSINKTAHAVSTVHADHAVKSFSRHSSGEAFWVQSTGLTYHGDTRNRVDPDVGFFDASGARSFTRGLSYGAEFYKARLHAVGCH